jgi:hypothetical protein
MDTTTCEVCHRALFVKDGPVCVHCRPVVTEVPVEPVEDEAKTTEVKKK